MQLTLHSFTIYNRQCLSPSPAIFSQRSRFPIASKPAPTINLNRPFSSAVDPMPEKSPTAAAAKVSFDLLATESSGDERSLSPSPSPRECPGTPPLNAVSLNGEVRPSRRRRKSKKKRPESNGHGDENGLGFANGTVIESSVVCDKLEFDGSPVSSCVTSVELRQRNVNNGGSSDVPAVESIGIKGGSESNSILETSASTKGQWRPEEREVTVARLETMESLDWKQVMAQDPTLLGGFLLNFIYTCRYKIYQI